MSEPPERSRRKPVHYHRTGTAITGMFGPVLFLTPLVLAVTSPRALIGVETLLCLVGVIALNAAFVASETAIELLRSTHAKQTMADEKKHKAVLDLMSGKPLFVAACVLGSQTMRAWAVLLVIPLAMDFSKWVSSWTRLPDGWESVLVAGFLVAIPVVAANVVFGELIPKTFAAADPVKTAYRSYRFVKACAAVFKPFAAIFVSIAELLTKRIGARVSFSVTNQAEEEIKERLEQAVETQEIEEEEKDMLHSVFEFGDTVAREVMTPRVDIDAVPVDATLEHIAHVVEESGHSRIPVYEGTDDQILGIVHAKDVLSALRNGKAATPLRKIIRTPVFVPENKSLHDLLQEMRAAKTQMVIVQDEFGGTAGVVTMEDIVEEVVGEIVDEYDTEEESIVQTNHGFIVEGKTNLYDINDDMGTQFESQEFDTIGGYVFGLFGRQPDQGESVADGDYLFTVIKTDGRRIHAIEVTKAEQPDGFLQRMANGQPV